MKRIINTLSQLLIIILTVAQSPEKMSYQAVVRDAGNNLVSNTTIGMQISLLQGSPNGTVVYSETQTPTSNFNGLISLEIGTGNTTDDFSSIDWATGSYFIKTETDLTGGSDYTITGTIQLLSVPYALHAKTASSYTESDPKVGDNTINYLPKWDGNALVSSSIFDNGKVGIGTTNPSGVLDVVQEGSTFNVNFTAINDLTLGSYLGLKKARGTIASPTDVLNNDIMGIVGGSGKSGFSYFSTASLRFEVDGTVTSGQRPPSRISFLTNPDNITATERMRIDKDGNVGIGTSAPNQKLEVDGNISADEFFTPSNSSNYHKYRLNGDITGYAIGMSSTDNLGFVNAWSNTFTWRDGEGYGWIWRNQNGTGWMSLNSKDGGFYLKGKAHFDDQVGIGIDSPNAKLEVAEYPSGTNDPVAIRITNLRSSLKLFWELRAYDSGAGGPYGRFSIFGGTSGGEDRLVVTTNGNVGVGTIDPKSKMHVVGLPEHADNAAAISAGLTVGAFYRTGDLLKVVH